MGRRVYLPYMIKTIITIPLFGHVRTCAVIERTVHSFIITYAHYMCLLNSALENTVNKEGREKLYESQTL